VTASVISNFGVAVITVRQGIAVIRTQVKCPWPCIDSTGLRVNDDRAVIIGIVMIVPVRRRCPGIAKAAAIVSSVIIATAEIIGIVEVRPAVAVPYFHPQVLVLVVGIVIIPVLAVILFFGIHILFLSLGAGIIQIVRCLSGLVRSSATA
jgi:hypothetical protein